MSTNNSLFTAATKLEKAMSPRLNAECVDKQDTTMAQDLAEIVKKHALGAAASGLGVAWIPGVGSTAAMLSMTGFIWSMYFRINYRIGLKFSKVMLKTLASAVMSNLAQGALSVIGATVVAGLLSLTGAGNVFASAIMAALDYSVVMVGGILYLKLLTGLFGAGSDPNHMSEKELVVAMEDVIHNENISDMLKASKKEYTAERKKGNFTGDETVELVDDAEIV